MGKLSHVSLPPQAPLFGCLSSKFSVPPLAPMAPDHSDTLLETLQVRLGTQTTRLQVHELFHEDVSYWVMQLSLPLHQI